MAFYLPRSSLITFNNVLQFLVHKSWASLVKSIANMSTVIHVVTDVTFPLPPQSCRILTEFTQMLFKKREKKPSLNFLIVATAMEAAETRVSIFAGQG